MATSYLNQYQCADFLIDQVDLTIDLQDTATKVVATYRMRRHPDATNQKAPLVLVGEDMQLLKLAIDGIDLAPNTYQVGANTLTIFEVPEHFECTQEVVINPSANTQLSGLYKSDGCFCTQCESEGFRRIAYALDRPDILSLYEVTLIADRIQYPVLLSNGHCVDQGDDGADRHWAKWVDPHPKPSYLFACS